jgi:predicted DNA-binding protein
MTMLATSFALPPAERKALDQLKALTGVSKTNIIRRLITHYACANKVDGLPALDGPINNPITKGKS